MEPQDQQLPQSTDLQSLDSKDALHQQSHAPYTPSRHHSQQPHTAAGTPSSAADDDDADADGDDDDQDNDGDSSKLTKGVSLTVANVLASAQASQSHPSPACIRSSSRGWQSCYPLVQHFDALPDRRENPQYYQLISKPVSLRDIEHRVFAKDYINAHASLSISSSCSTTPCPSTLPSILLQDAAEIRQYFEREAIPALIQDGFTLEKDDVRQSALPLHLAANSTIEAHKVAYKMLVSKTAGGEGASQSPEPLRNRDSARWCCRFTCIVCSPGTAAGSPAAYGSPAPLPQSMNAVGMSTPTANLPPMMGTPGSMPMSMPMAPPTTSMSPMPGVPVWGWLALLDDQCSILELR